MKISWPNSLINDIARRRCVIFLGSGISRNSVNATGLHPKTWVEHTPTETQIWMLPHQTMTASAA